MACPSASVATGRLPVTAASSSVLMLVFAATGALLLPTSIEKLSVTVPLLLSVATTVIDSVPVKLPLP